MTLDNLGCKVLDAKSSGDGAADCVGVGLEGSGLKIQTKYVTKVVV